MHIPIDSGGRKWKLSDFDIYRGNPYDSGIWPIINMLRSISAETVFSRQNVTSTDVTFWRLKLILAL